MYRNDRPAALCVTNAKGGTGKTTVAINVAGALNERGRDVLFVDLDPQGNATEGLGLVEAYDAAPPTLFDVLTDPEQRSAVHDLIVPHDEMDVLPSNIDMLQAEHELTLANVMATLDADPSLGVDPAVLEPLTINVGPETFSGETALDGLEKVLAELSGYDYVVVDSPPFYGQLTDTAIYATGNVLIPALTEATSERAIELLFDQIAALEDRTGESVREVGVVANRVESTNEDAEMLDWLEAVFEDVPVWSIRKRVALQRAFSSGQSLFTHDPAVDMADRFLEIAADLDRQYGFAEEIPQ
ncbi:ParA family protein [Halorientalis sp.]|uniref:ParA family protein n=1 Tax=Halorientalis sp. TaxID=1931229 RepID=UPI002612290E|nr:ParA family protein [Halorientalis sp.]